VLTRGGATDLPVAKIGTRCGKERQEPSNKRKAWENYQYWDAATQEYTWETLFCARYNPTEQQKWWGRKEGGGLKEL